MSARTGLRPLMPILLLLAGRVAPSRGSDSPADPGTVEIRVSDSSGARVADAEVLLQRGALAVLRVPPAPDVTGAPAGGCYVLPGLLPGSYVLTVVKAGFAPASRGVVVLSGRSMTVPVTLAPQGLTESVTVVGEALVEGSVLKLPTTLHEMPRSVTVVGSDRMREENLRSVNDTLAYVPGMTVNSYRTGGYHFYSRGYRMLPDDTRVDGFAGLNAGGRYSASLFGIEQAVLLRGPAGLLYGSSGAPGGFVNLVTKKPLDQRMTRVDLRAGSYAGNGVSLGERPSGGLDLDSTGPVAGSHRVLYRALATVENANYFTGGVLDENRYLHGSLTFKLDPDGRSTITPLVQWTRMARPNGGGIVASPSTSLATNDGVSGPIHTDDLSPLDVNLSEGGGLDETLQGGLRVATRLGDAWRIDGAYRFIAYDTDIDQFAPQATTPAQIALLREAGLVQRVQAKSQTERRYHNFDVSSIWEAHPVGSWRSLFQAGFHGRQASTRATAPQGLAPGPQSAVDIYTGRTLAPTEDLYPAVAWNAWTDASYWNAHFQNRTALLHDRLVFTLGVGYGENTFGDGPARPSGILPNLGVVWNAGSRLALYTSYAVSYNPADPAAEDASGNANVFDATTGSSYEAGAKWDSPGGRASGTLALFHSEVDNGLVQSGPGDLNPNGNRYYVAAGTRRGRGVELTTDLRPIPSWQLSASLSYLDAIYTGEGPPSAAATLAIPGSRAEKSPEWSWSLRTRYDVWTGRRRGLGASLGVVWQDVRLGGNGARTPVAPDPLELPSFTRVDAGLHYRAGEHVDLGLNVENLLDALVFVSGTVGSSLEVAAPRTLTLRLGYRF
jgi:iron complex outermembrane receptor protein